MVIADLREFLAEAGACDGETATDGVPQIQLCHPEYQSMGLSTMDYPFKNHNPINSVIHEIICSMGVSSVSFSDFHFKLSTFFRNLINSLKNLVNIGIIGNDRS